MIDKHLISKNSFRTSRIRWCVFLFLGLFLLNSCANYTLNYVSSTQNWRDNHPEWPADSIAHSVFLIGDCGINSYKSQHQKVLSLLQKKISGSTENTSVVFLGNNSYPTGIPPKMEWQERLEHTNNLDAQLDALKTFKGRSFFLPGNMDWKKYGLAGIRRQEKYIEKILDNKDVFFPESGCGEPYSIDLNDHLTLIIVDTQWWLEDWRDEPEMNDGCEVKSREVFKLSLEEAIKDARNKNVIIAMHHPLFSGGPRGGQFSVRQHLFPLTDAVPGFWLPLPIIGSLYPVYHSIIGSEQDINHPEYQALRKIVTDIAQKNGSFIFAAGHEHNLQYLEIENQAYIVSGAGSISSPSKLIKGSQFATGKGGFAQVDFYKDGTAWLKFWAIDENVPDGSLVFYKKIKGPLKSIQQERNQVQSFPFYDSGVKQVKLPLTNYDFSKNGFGTFLWGDHYRDVYSLEITVPVLDLAEFQGGVLPTKRGGGYQTNSLRVVTKDGREYTLRSLDKDADRAVPYPLNQSFVLNIVNDYFSSSHPLSALPVPVLANAIGVYHANPKLYYIPKQPILGAFNVDYGDALYLVEERPDDDLWKDADNFGNPDNVVSFSKVLQNKTEHHGAKIDQHAVIKARIFDILLGDWDRHDDQWRWAEIEQGKEKIYRPIPRDRDQAFSNYDGFLTSLGRPTIPYARQIRAFSGNLRSVQWNSYNARYFDKTFLNELEWEEWLKEANHVVEHLTDAVIDSAFKTSWPPEVYQLNGPQIEAALKKRRDKLVDELYPFYRFLSKKVDIIGTEKRDLFVVERFDGQTLVSVYDTNKDKEKQNLYYQRYFKDYETQELVLYGLGEDDFFDVIDSGESKIKLRLVGGLGKDGYSCNDQSVKHQGIIIYDTKTQSSTFQGEARDLKLRLSDDPVLNSYNRKSKDYENSYNLLIPSISFNADDGFLAGFRLGRTQFGFKKDPYKQTHGLSIAYSQETSGIRLKYSGNFIDLVRKWDLNLEGIYQSPLYASNYYGLGNESLSKEEELEEEYHRVRQQLISFSPVFNRKFNKATRFYLSPFWEYVAIEKTQGRIFDDETVAGAIDPNLFSGLNFLGGKTGIEYSNLDDSDFPTHGINFNAELGWKKILNDAQKEYGFINAGLSYFAKLEKQGRLIFASRIAFRHLFNNDFPFFDGARLGGTGEYSNFRGWRRDRFIGQTAFVHNTDLRFKLITLNNNSIPFTMGVLAGFDYGRVWLDEEVEQSAVMHYSYGGGVFLTPLEMISINLSLFRGDEKEWRFLFGSRFFF